MTETVFKKALPVWIKGKENEMNICAELVYRSDGKGGVLRVAGASFFEVFFDGSLAHFGPARKAKGYSAADEIKIPSGAKKAVIRVSGYNCPAFNGVLQSSFIAAEVERDGAILAATGFDGFDCRENKKRIQKTARYSFQRHFTESWDMTKPLEKAEFATVDPKVTFSLRDVPYATLIPYAAEPLGVSGTFEYENEYRYDLRWFIKDRVHTVEFEDDELESKTYYEWLKIKTSYLPSKASKRLSGGQCGIWDLKKVTAGFWKIKVKAKTDSRFILSYAEDIDENYCFYRKAFNVIDLIDWTVGEGEWTLYSFEPYSARYAEFIVTKGEIEVEYVGMEEFGFDESLIITKAPDDPELGEVYRAAVRTFRHNVIDIYMDCPSRERAGWLFDSFYTGKAERFFTGRSTVERAFLDNFAKGGDRAEDPGMINMLYPGNFAKKEFIPQWAMWYAIEVCDYVTERGGESEKDKFKAQLERLVGYFEKFKNEYGLFENLDNFNFIEWSDLNNRVKDVSWPTNMLYARMLELLGGVYGRPEWIKEAESIKNTVRESAFDGTLFCDRAVRTDKNRLENTPERSETTQYYALFLKTSTPGDPTYAPLKKMVLDVFTTPKMDEYSNILKSEMFMGVYFKIDVLLEMKEPDKALGEIKKTFLPMAKTGSTLWEHISGYKSRNHGFASYAAAAIDKALKLKKEGF